MHQLEMPRTTMSHLFRDVRRRRSIRDLDPSTGRESRVPVVDDDVAGSEPFQDHHQLAVLVTDADWNHLRDLVAHAIHERSFEPTLQAALRDHRSAGAEPGLKLHG